MSGFMDKLFEKRSNTFNPLLPRDPAMALLFGSGGETSSGISVSPAKALQVSTVMGCVRVLAESVAMLPLEVHRGDSVGKKDLARDHSLFGLLKLIPNRVQTSFCWREMLMAHLLLRGNHFSLIVSNNSGAITELVPMNPDRVFVFRAPDGRRAYRYITAKNESTILLQEEVFHVMGLPSPTLTPDDPYFGLIGLNPIEYARESIGLALATQEYGARLFSNNASPRGVLQTDKRMSDEAMKHLKASWNDAHAGLSNAHKIAILEEGLKFQAVSMSNDDAQFLESRKFQREEIAAIFRVPPHKLAILERATFSNIEQQAIEFVTDCLMPWLERIEQQIMVSLLSESERQAGYYAKFNVNALMRGDAAARANYYKERFATGTMSQNDIRRAENENPIPDGDRFYVPVNMAPTDKIDEFLSKKSPDQTGNVTK